LQRQLLVCRLKSGLNDRNISTFLGNLSKLISFEYIDEEHVKTDFLLDNAGYGTINMMLEVCVTN